MAYNLLEYWNTATNGSNTFRDPYFITVIDSVAPDIISAVEINDNTSGNATSFLNNVLNHSGTLFQMGTFLPDIDYSTSIAHSDANVIYYKPSKFTFLSSKLIIADNQPANTNHPSYEYQLYNNLTGNKIVIYGIHLTSGNNSSGETLRYKNADTVRAYSDALPLGSYFIAAGDFNFYSGGLEPALDTLYNTSKSGYFIDPLSLSTSNNWSTSPYYPYHTLSTRTSSFANSSESYGLKYRSDLILNSQTIVDPGGVTYLSNSYTTFGNDGQHYGKSLLDSPTNTSVSSTVNTALYYASDHLPVYADYTFAVPATTNPPYPGSIVFTQVGVNDGSSNNYIEFMTLYRMNLIGLKITNNSIKSDSTLNTGGGTIDLSGTGWINIPAGTFVRLGPNLTNSNDTTSRIIQLNTSSSGLTLSSGGNQLIAYTGSSPSPTYYIAGIHWGDTQGWTGTSNAPTSPSSSNIELKASAADNWYYSSSVDGNLYITRNSLTTATNWSTITGGYQNLTSTIGNSLLPVQLSSFNGVISNGESNLYWRTETEVNNYGFEVERSTDKIIWDNVGFVKGSGNSNSPKNYSFKDKFIPSGKIFYRLKQEDNDGKFEYSEVIELDNVVAPIVKLSQNYPNPFNPVTTIEYQVPVQSKVTLKIIDVLGREVKTLVDGEVGAGVHRVPFDGSALSSGIYIYQLVTNGKLYTKKMILLK